MADTVIAVIDNKGQLASRTIWSTGAKVSYAAAYKMNLGLLADTTQMLGGTPYISGSFSRATADTSMLALSPSWTQKLGATGTTQVLRDSTVYDAWGRLTAWVGTRDGVAQNSAGYTFDGTGNTRQSYEQPLVFDAATDRLVSRVVTSGTHYYTYDRAGNLVTDSVPGVVVAKFNYDALNRLVSVVRNGVLIARYGYDVLGRRIVKRVYSMQTGADTLYLRMVYSGSDVSFETDSAGTIGLKYTWGSGSDNLLAIEDEAGNHYYATNPQMSQMACDDADGPSRFGAWAICVICGLAGPGESMMSSSACTTTGPATTRSRSGGLFRRTRWRAARAPMPMCMGHRSKPPTRVG